MSKTITADQAVSEALRTGACCDVSPSYAICSRGRGHKGQHMAFDSGQRVAVWSSKR